MTQTEHPETPTPNTKTKPQCHIHDNVKVWEVKNIRANVCVNNEDVKEYKGKHYCLFHLPTKDKDIQEFEKSFRDRLEEVEQNLAEIEKLPEEEQEKEKAKLRYDFRYIWFPSFLNLSDYKFEVVANFRSATFSAFANFRSVIFSAFAFFNSVTFSASADFSSATFSAFANFSSATFSTSAYFNSTTFSYSAYFNSAKVEESSQIFFIRTSFQGISDFSQAIVKGYLYFEAGIGEFFDGEWLDEKKTEPKKIERKTSVFENRLEFAHVGAEKPERITFNKVRLHPSWFINIDSRKFVFTDIAWENHKGRKSELNEELVALIERDFQEPHNFQLLTIAFRNLAANAEEFNRFEEASNFRKSASECERLERLNRRKTWMPEFSIHSLYGYLSGYGEKWGYAFGWLLFIWIAFAVIYYFAQGFEGKTLDFGDSIGYSLQVMTLQRPEPRPETGLTRVIYGMETIFAPLQAALLALAIRRKFMR